LLVCEKVKVFAAKAPEELRSENIKMMDRARLRLFRFTLSCFENQH